jgi:adenosine deaminase
MNLRAAIEKLPKIELHCHLDGSLRPETVWELAQERPLKLPIQNQSEVQKFFNATGRKSLSDYLTLFGYTVPLMQTREALQRCVSELIQDFAAETGKYIEIRYAPFLHTQGRLHPEHVVEATIDGVREGERKTGIKARLILIGMRQDSTELSLEVARLAVAYQKKGVVAFDIAGPEKGNPPQKHVRAFEYAKSNNLFVTIHAGEEDCPDYISQALDLSTDRLGHGLHLEFAKETVQDRVKEKNIALEVCPTSNLQTKCWDRYTLHPLVRYYQKGFRVTVNTDNRLMSDTTNTNELFQIHDAFELDLKILKTFTQNAARAAFLPEPERAELLKLVSE